MEKIIKEINRLLIKKKKTLAVAESCTGGLLSDALTKIKGSSLYFLLGVVAYSKEAKQKILKVPYRLLLKEGPVSKKTTEFMASSIRKLACADFGIGITGFAGPTGGSKKNPVGTVFIAIKSKDRIISKSYLFKGSRQMVKKKAVLETLKILKKILLNL